MQGVLYLWRRFDPVYNMSNVSPCVWNQISVNPKINSSNTAIIRMLFEATQNHEHSTSGHSFHKLQSSRTALCVFGRRLHQRDTQQEFVWTQAREMPQVGPNMWAHLVSLA